MGISEMQALDSARLTDMHGLLLSVHSRLDGIDSRQRVAITIGAVALCAVAIVAKPHIEKGLSRLRQRRRAKLAAA